MITEILLVGTGAVVTLMFAAPSRTEEHKKRQQMHDRINEEQIENHRQTDASIAGLFQKLRSISRQYGTTNKVLRAIHTKSSATLDGTVKNAEDVTSQAQQATQKFQNLSLETEQKLQLSACEMEHMITALSAQLKRIQTTIPDSESVDLSVILAYEKKIEALVKDNAELKKALKQSMNDVEGLVVVNIGLQKRVAELEQKIEQNNENPSSLGLTMFGRV